jgi:O-antigen/teichoic acid export membrane protein
MRVFEPLRALVPFRRGEGDWLRLSVLLSASLAVGGGMNYLYHIALGRLLGPEVYGVFGALLGIFYLLWIFSQSVQLRLARAAALTPGFPKRALWATLRMGAGIAVILSALSPWLAGWLRLDSPLWIVWVAGIWLVVLPLPAVKGFLQGRQRFTRLAMLNVAEPAVKLFVGLLLVAWGAGLLGAWAAWGLAALVVLSLAGVGASERTVAAPSGSAALPVPTHGSLALLAAFALAVPTNVDVLIAKHTFSAEAAGLYAAAAVLGKGFLFVAMGVGAVLLPKAARASEPSDRRAHLRTALSIAFGLGALGALLAVLFPEWILRTLFGAAYEGSAPVLRLYGPAMLAFTGVVLLLNYGLALGRRPLVYGLAVLSAFEASLLAAGARSPEGLATIFLAAQGGLLGAGALLIRLGGRTRAASEGTVILVTPYPPPDEKHGFASGVASYTRNLVEALRTSGHNATVLAQRLSENRSRNSHEESGVVRCWTPSWGYALNIWQEVRRRRPALVHLQHELFLFGDGPKAVLFPLLIWLLRLQATVVVTLHGVPPLAGLDREFLKENGLRGHPALLRLGLALFFQAIIAGAHVVIVHENVLKERLKREYRCPPEKLTVIPHGIEVPKEGEALPSAGEAKRALGLEGKRTILYLGYLTGYKGIEVLLEAVARAAPDHPDWALVLAGGPHPRRLEERDYQRSLRDIEEKIEQLGAQGKRLGFVPENRLETVFRAADVVVFPYRVVMASSGPLALCMKYDRPFLASKAFAGVLPAELLVDLDPEALTATLEAFFASSRLSETARRVASEWRASRSWDRVAEQTWVLYQSLFRRGEAQTGEGLWEIEHRRAASSEGSSSC